MKKTPLFLLIVLLSVNFCFSQKEFRVKFSNGAFIPEEIEPDKRADKYLIGLLAEDRYQLIQFYKLPTKDQVQSLKNAGIKLIDYLPENTYTAIVDTQKLRDTQKLNIDSENVRSVFSFPADYKIDKRLTSSGKLPEWTEPEFGKVKVNVVFYRDFNPEDFKTYIEGWDVEILKISERFGRITLNTAVQYLEKIAKYDAVKWIEPVEPPKKPVNYEAKISHRTNVLNANYAGARSLTGNGIVIGEWDGGKIGEHQDLYGRVDNNSSQEAHWHATHVAGTILGKGILDPDAKGMAPDAELYASDFMQDATEIAEEMSNSVSTNSVDISSNSWGYSIDQYICDHPFPYISSASFYDEVAFEHKKLTHVFANGNDQQVCPGGYWTSSWTMKNAILVGAVNDTNGMSDFSSFGPLFDGRLAPHISGVGVNVYSTFLDNYYYSSDGTSMATPAVSGAIALLYERYKEIHGEMPTSALIRSVLFNTAEDMGNEGPDYKYGFGKVNLKKAVETIEDNHYFTNNITNNSEQTYDINVPANTKQLKVTLSWTDQAGTPFAETPLVNDLDLTVDHEGNTWLPWILDKNNPSALATKGEDHVSNFERVTIENPAEGTYTIKIQGEKIVAFEGMDYTVSYQVDTPGISVTHPVGGEHLIAGETDYIRWDAVDTSGTFTIELSNDGGQNWSALASDIDGNKRFFEFFIPQTFTSEALVRISRDNQSDQSDAEFTIVGKPVNFSAEEQYQALNLHWDSVPGATSYNIFKAEQGQLNLLGTTSDTTFYIDGLETGRKNWLTIRARRDQDEIVGKRVKAISPKPIPRYDYSVYQISEPTSGINLTSAEEITAKVVNKGANSLLSGDTLPLAYSINEGGVIRENLILEESFSRQDTLTYTFDQTAYMATHDNYTIKVWTEHPRDTFYADNDLKETVVTNSEPITDFPYTEDFDDFSNLMISSADDPVYLDDNWNNDHIKDDIEWWPNSGETYKEGTGPYEDHTSGQGKYLYTEAYILDGKPGDAYLYSPGFNISQLDDPALMFWYHMFAKDSVMGDFHVDIYSVENDTLYENIIPAISGSQGQEWHRKTVNLEDFKDQGVIRIRFRVDINGHYQNAFAIDDVTVTDLYQSNFGIIGMKPETGRGHLTEQESVQVSLVNISPDTIATGTEIPVGYQYAQHAPVSEIYTLAEQLPPFDTLDYTFSQTADLSDLTQRYEFKSWVAVPSDNHAENDTLSEHFVQSYCEPRSDCYSNGSPTGVGTFILEGIHEEFGIRNTNSLCGSTGLNGYSYHGDQMATLYTGTGYQMQIQCIVPPEGYNVPVFGEFFKIWIDFDQSGSFEEEELVYTNKQRDIDLLTDTIQIPENAVPGETRMRVRSSYYQEDIISPTQTCSPIDHGETEDYSVKILPYPATDMSSLELTQLPATNPDLGANEQIGLTTVSKGNQQLDAGTKVPFAYQVNDQQLVRDTLVLDHALERGDTTDFVFDQSINMSTIGQYSIRLWNEQQADSDPWNDTLMTRIHNMEKFDGNEYQADFEEGENGWFDESERMQPVWEKGTPDQEHISSAYQGEEAWMTDLDTAYPHESKMLLYTPAFNFSDMDAPLVSFWMYFRTEFNWDGMIMEASIDGENWRKVGNVYDQSFYNNMESNNPQWGLGIPWWSGNNTGWKKYEVLLDNYRGESKVLLRYRFRSDLYMNDEGVAIDEFSIVEKKTDLGIAQYVGPKDYGSLTERENIVFKYANLGTTTFAHDESIDIEVWVNDVYKQYTYELTSDILPGDTLTYTTPTSFDMSAEKTYDIRIKASYTGDEDKSNNEYTYTIESPVTGIESPRAEGMRMQVYPNPTKGRFIVELDSKERATYHVQVYNESGRKIREMKKPHVSYLKKNFDLTGGDPGIYLIKFNIRDHSLIKKIVVK